MITTILLILGLVCFILATINIWTRINLVALGLAFWILSQLIP
jgi:hypothetical protein